MNRYDENQVIVNMSCTASGDLVSPIKSFVSILQAPIRFIIHAAHSLPLQWLNDVIMIFLQLMENGVSGSVVGLIGLASGRAPVFSISYVSVLVYIPLV